MIIAKIDNFHGSFEFLGQRVTTPPFVESRYTVDKRFRSNVGGIDFRSLNKGPRQIVRFRRNASLIQVIERTPAGTSSFAANRRRFSHYSNKTGALLKSFVTDSWHFDQIAPRRKRPR